MKIKQEVATLRTKKNNQMVTVLSILVSAEGWYFLSQGKEGGGEGRMRQVWGTKCVVLKEERIFTSCRSYPGSKGENCFASSSRQTS